MNKQKKKKFYLNLIFIVLMNIILTIYSYGMLQLIKNNIESYEKQIILNHKISKILIEIENIEEQELKNKKSLELKEYTENFNLNLKSYKTLQGFYQENVGNISLNFLKLNLEKTFNKNIWEIERIWESFYSDLKINIKQVKFDTLENKNYIEKNYVEINNLLNENKNFLLEEFNDSIIILLSLNVCALIFSMFLYNYLVNKKEIKTNLLNSKKAFLLYVDIDTKNRKCVLLNSLTEDFIDKFEIDVETKEDDFALVVEKLCNKRDKQKILNGLYDIVENNLTEEVKSINNSLSGLKLENKNIYISIEISRTNRSKNILIIKIFDETDTHKEKIILESRKKGNEEILEILPIVVINEKEDIDYFLISSRIKLKEVSEDLIKRYAKLDSVQDFSFSINNLEKLREDLIKLKIKSLEGKLNEIKNSLKLLDKKKILVRELESIVEKINDIIKYIKIVELTKEKIENLETEYDLKWVKKELKINDFIPELQVQELKDNFIQELQKIIDNESQNWNKEINLKFDTELLIVLNKYFNKDEVELCKEIIKHMVANSCMHGIENKLNRVIAEKSQKALIEVSYKLLNNELDIIIKDDGAGINEEKIKSILLDSGILLSDIEKMSRLEIMSKIFVNGFTTTKGQVNERKGYGLSMVSESLKKIKGKLNLKTSNKETIFTIKFLIK